MVAGACGDANEGEVVAECDAGNRRLRAVPTCHAEHVGAAGDGLLGKPEQVVSWCQHHRLDSSPAGLLDQVEPLDVAAARPGVHEQDRSGCRPDGHPGGGATLE